MIDATKSTFTFAQGPVMRPLSLRRSDHGQEGSMRALDARHVRGRIRRERGHRQHVILGRPSTVGA